MFKQWKDFKLGRWTEEIDIRDFIQANYKPYDDDASFLCPPTERTRKLWYKCQELLQQERAKGGVLEVDPDTPITITSHSPGYIDKDLELIVGLQTDKPLKRAINIYGGLRNSVKACHAYGYEPPPELVDFFKNTGVLIMMGFLPFIPQKCDWPAVLE